LLDLSTFFFFPFLNQRPHPITGPPSKTNLHFWCFSPFQALSCHSSGLYLRMLSTRRETPPIYQLGEFSCYFMGTHTKFKCTASEAYHRLLAGSKDSPALW
jgi:hypothetical protein